MVRNTMQATGYRGGTRGRETKKLSRGKEGERWGEGEKEGMLK
jgi:hypothetical protein